MASSGELHCQQQLYLYVIGVHRSVPRTIEYFQFGFGYIKSIILISQNIEYFQFRFD